MKENTPKRALMDDCIAFSPTLGEAFGICGALILQQMHYWIMWEKCKVKENHHWVYNPHRVWAGQLRVYTERTVRDKIIELEGLGILVTGNYNPSKYDQTKWYRIDYPVLMKHLKNRLPTEHFVTTPYGNAFRVHRELSAPLHTEKISVSEYKDYPKTSTEITLAQPAATRIGKITIKRAAGGETKTLHAPVAPVAPVAVEGVVGKEAPAMVKSKALPPPALPAPAAPEPVTPGPVLSAVPLGGGDVASHVQTVLEFVGLSALKAKAPPQYAPNSANAILAHLQSSQGRAKPKPVNTCASLTALWQSLVPRHHSSVGMMPSLTLQKKGQLSHLATALKGRSDEVLMHVIVNWIGYCKFVSAQCGLGKTPDVPAIGFLLLHVNEALAFTQNGYPPVHLVAQNTPVSGILNSSPPSEKPPVAPPGQPFAVIENDVLTLDDLLAWKNYKE